MRAAARSRTGFLWPLVGLLGSVLATAAATRLLDGRPIRWWWRAPLPPGHGVELDLFWVGVLLLCAGWIGLGARLGREGAPSVRALTVVAGIWATPLALGPAIFSQDVFSYLAQGSILRHGLNPYSVAPAAALSRWHEAGLLHAVSVNWRTTTAPYGPVFLALAGLAGAGAGLRGAAGSQLALSVELIRAVAVAGLALLAYFVPRVARRLGADPARAVWITVASPLALLYFVGSGHNDALMAGLMVAGIAFALDGRPLAGIAVCMLAAAIKLPAAVGALAIGICWVRAHPRRWRSISAAAAGVAAVTVLLVGIVTGVGLSWISGPQISTTAGARLAITPATAVAVTIHELWHGVHAGVQQAAAPIERAAAWIALTLVLLVAAWLCARVRYARLVRVCGLVLLIAAIGGPEAWPWYLIWGVALLAVDPVAQRSPWVAVAALVPAFAVMPGGDVAVPLPQAYKLVIVYGATAGLALWEAWRRRRRPERSIAPVLPVAYGSVEAT